MRKLITSILPIYFLLLINNGVYAQSKYIKKIENGGIEKVEKLTLKALSKDPNNLEAKYAYCTLLSTKEYNKYDLEGAYNNTIELKKGYESLSDLKVKNKLLEKEIDQIAIEKLLKSIIDSVYSNTINKKELAALFKFIATYKEADLDQKRNIYNSIHLIEFQNASNKNTIDSYQNFIDTYPTSSQINQAIVLRNKIAFQNAVKENTPNAYQYFIDKYPKAEQLNIAIQYRNASAFQAATNENTIKSYQNFIDRYPNASERKEAISKRDWLLFKEAEARNTVQSYTNFINNYPASIYTNDAKVKIQEIEFKAAIKNNNSESISNFINKWPNSKLKDSAYALFELLQYKENTSSNTIEEFKSFIKNYPNNSYNISAEDSIYSIGKRLNDLVALEYCIDNFNSSIKDSALICYFKIYTNDGEKITINTFYEKFSEKENINKDLIDNLRDNANEIATLGDELSLHKPFNKNYLYKYDKYIKLAAPNERAFITLQKIISEELIKKNWQGAAKIVTSYLPYFSKDRKKIDNLIYLLNKPIDPNIKINDIGPQINTKNGGEYSTVISADNKYLYFCGKFRNQFNVDEDIYVSKINNNIYGPASNLKEFNYYGTNQAPVSIAADGTTMIVFTDGKLNIAEKNRNKKWEIRNTLPETINSGRWQADAKISSDKKALVFSSIRETNMNYHTNNSIENYHGNTNYPSDIYVSLLDEEGNWSEPINLGPKINTIYSDRSPFLHPDMKTLYFSSDGHGGLGNYDIFKSTRLYDSCWDCWSEPINLGKEFNTYNEDWGLVISTDGEKAYLNKQDLYVSNGKYYENQNIYWSKMPGYLRPDFVATISGKLLDNNNQPIIAKIRWEDLETKKIIGIANSDPEDGSYFIVLPLGKMYGYYIDDNHLFPSANNLDLRSFKKQVSIQNDIKTISYEDMFEKKISASMNNIFFKFGVATLESTSIPELKRIAKIIIEKKIKVQIIGHTDNIGTDETNQILSEERANTIKSFLVNEGCPNEDIIIKGYGESMPISNNNTEEGRAKNRRVEIKFETKSI